MRYLSVCSGIEAATVAWTPLGWQAVAFAEIEKFSGALLAYRYPDVPNLGDMRGIKSADFRGKIDVLVGGTPCQSFSVAGLRRGLEDERGSLALEFVRIADESEPAFVVWENVPGVLSDRGNAFGCFLGALAGEASQLEPPGGSWTNSGYVLGPQRSIAWRTLDAQYFGLAQRRKRVFLVACPRNGTDPRKVLFEYGGLRRDSAPSRQTAEDVAGTLEGRLGSSRGAVTPPGAITQALTGRMGEGGPDDNKAQGGFYVAAFGGECSRGRDIATSLGAHDRRQWETDTFIAAALRAEGFDASEDGTGRQNLVVAPQLTGNQYSDHESREGLLVPTQFPCPASANPKSVDMVACVAIRGREGGANVEMRADGTANTLRASEGGRGGEGCGAVLHRSAIRRLTPRECERLQGFPDDYTLIPYRGKPAADCADGPRYKALGNSMAVPVMRWIGERIQLYRE